VGETFHPDSERTTIGRSPDCGIFLDDVTVSRRHAVLSRHDGLYTIEDQGSLNGTFVNRKRVESAQLEDGDELQIGKYRLTFLNR
jgi:pSer/pThr/pTyr-binding forkhead associated (FHA) protein